MKDEQVIKYWIDGIVESAIGRSLVLNGTSLTKRFSISNYLIGRRIRNNLIIHDEFNKLGYLTKKSNGHNIIRCNLKDISKVSIFLTKSRKLAGPATQSIVDCRAYYARACEMIQVFNRNRIDIPFAHIRSEECGEIDRFLYMNQTYEQPSEAVLILEGEHECRFVTHNDAVREKLKSSDDVKFYDLRGKLPRFKY